ncbi:MAG: arabinosyltransferase domain-containing protein, partial [Pseudonocardiales bacterium]|nr:arabinosyltransferase domain-containing protein [Pseudonocardiales bacterium]
MLSPAQPAAPPAPRPPAPHRRGPHLVLVLGLVALLAAVAFPFAPVVQPRAEYSWSAADGAAAIPLMPYEPVSLTVTTTCATARTDGLLLATVPPRPDPAAAPLAGLRLLAQGGSLAVASAGADLGTVRLPAGACAVTLTSDHARTELRVDGAPVLVHEGDVRPSVAGAFSDAGGGVEMVLVADTRFETTISPLKAGIAAAGVLALLGMLLALARTDGRARVRLLPRRWWRPRPVDAAVTALLGVWWVVGAITVDDGYIAGIVRSRGPNGFVGNVYRWLNAPEAPFSWFYDLSYLWSLVSPSTLWMRLPATLLGLVTWVLLSRALLPRLGRAAQRPWLAALAFGTWWVPYQLGLRPEPWVALGLLGVLLAVERAVATRRLLPLAVGLVLAGATTALTPGGIVAFTPVLAAVVPLLRLVRSRPDLGRWTLAVAGVAAPAAAVFLMVSDQSLAAMLEGTRVRQLVGGGVEWYQEVERYALLLEPASFQGAIGRRAALLVTLLAAVGVLLAGRRAGLAAGPVRRLAATVLLSLAVMTATPTKWTQHFGDLGGIGAAVLVVAAVTFASAPLRARPRAFGTALAAAVAVGALVLAGYNAWPYASAWFAPSFSDRPPQVLGVPVATLLALAGLAAVGLLAARAASAAAAGRPVPDVPPRVPGPASVLALVLTAVLALQVLSLARTAVERRDSYTLASDAVATLRGAPCGLQERLSVETDPVAGLLPPRTRPAVRAERTVDVGGVQVPGVAVAGSTTTAWFALDPARRSLPVVVTVSGAVRPGDVLRVEFGDAAGEVLETRAVTDTGESRQPVPEDAASVRLVVAGATGGTTALVTLPRVPLLTPMTELLPPGGTAVLDWPVAFLFPCLSPAPIRDGAAGLPGWRVAPPADDDAAGITYAPGFGGPFAAPRLLVTERIMATYLDGDPTRDAAQVVRWDPVEPMTTVDPVV